jgi:hypothetical protein
MIGDQNGCDTAFSFTSKNIYFHHQLMQKRQYLAAEKFTRMQEMNSPTFGI